MEQPSIFLSYAREDERTALRLFDDLTSSGARVWMDKKNLKGGEAWEPAIRNAIKNCEYFIALLSASSIGKKGFIQKETRIALEVLDECPPEQVYLIPVRLDDTKPQFERLKDLHWVDLFPSWGSGVKQILLSIDLRLGAKLGNGLAGQFGVQHPKGKSFQVEAEWTKDGLDIKGGKLRIPPQESKPLFEAWLKLLPEFVDKQRPESDSEAEALEKAFILASLRAVYAVYGMLPDETEMQKGLSILSRKLNLFHAFARDTYLKARKKGIDPSDYLLGKSNPAELHVEPKEDPRTLYRLLLHIYISRICDVNLEKVEQVEKLMKEQDAPPWEDLVEAVYEIDEQKVLAMFDEMKKVDPKVPDEDLVDHMTAGIIKLTAGLEAYPLES